MTLPDDITIVPDIDAEKLNQLQLEDYRDRRREALTWLYKQGKDPDERKGYSKTVIEDTAYRLSKIHRWVWERDAYTPSITHEHADAFVEELAHRDWTDANKNQYVKALKRYFAWKEHEQGADEWEPEQTYSPNTQTHHVRDYLSLEERQQIRDAALEYASFPSYDSCSPDERDRWNIYLAQRLEKPKRDVTREDWKQATSWKIPSLVGVGLDAGLRPIEVKRAKVSWVDVQNGLLRIPKEDDSKATRGGDNWTVGLRDDTTRHLSRWLDERATRPKYDGRDELWLTSHENPYGSSALNYLLEQLCDEAGIATENRDISWYSVRHSTGTYMTREEGLAAAQSQLRHKDERTTMRYDQVPVEDRQDALERM